MTFKGAAKSLTVVVFATILGAGFAYLAGANSVSMGVHSAVFVCAMVAFAVNWLAFIPSALAQKDTY